MSAIYFILMHLIFQPLSAATVDIPVTAGDHLVLVGLEAQVQVVGQPGNSLKISGVEENGAEGTFTVTKKDNIIQIKMNEYSGKQSWLNVLSKNAQLKKIEITGPAVPADFSLRNGSVVAQKWNKDLKINLTQGRASSANGTGMLHAYVLKGDINIKDHNGRVKIDAYNGSASLKNIAGNVEASIFGGQLQGEKIEGLISLITQQAAAKIIQSSGILQFENGRGSLNIQSHAGRIEGKNQEGSINVVMPVESEIDIRSKSGKINIQLQPNSGASLNLLTAEGEIVVPSELKVTKLSTEKSVRARLRGDAQKGSIFVRSQDGIISVK